MLDTEPRVHLYNKQKVMLYENFQLDISAYLSHNELQYVLKSFKRLPRAGAVS